MYMAHDQYGNHYFLESNPRKELMEKLGAGSAQEMYQDRLDGTTYHTGYIIRGHWITVYGLEGVTFARRLP